jgi:hypothetical protein
MKNQGWKRIYEIKGFYLLFSIPMLIAYFAETHRPGWGGAISIPYAIVIILFLVRASWMAYLRSKFSSLSLYAIRCVLMAFLVIAVMVVWYSVTGGLNEKPDALGIVVIFLFISLILIAEFGSYIEYFMGLFRRDSENE